MFWSKHIRSTREIERERERERKAQIRSPINRPHHNYCSLHFYITFICYHLLLQQQQNNDNNPQ